MKANSIDIAYRAGVSQSTVSRALRNSPLVNQKTREKIQAIAKELNYKVDKNASNLRLQSSATIALLLFEDPTSDDSLINPFFLSMLGSITRACAGSGYDLLVSFQQMNADWHADFEDSNKADGIILLGYGDFEDYKDKLQRLIERGTRFVRWGAEIPDQPVISIGCSNIDAGHKITRYLADKGRKKMAFLGGADSHSPEFWDRYRGHCKALEEAGLEVNNKLQFDAVSTEESGYEAANRLIDLNKPFDTIFAASDLIAIGAIRALKENYIRVPQDVAVVGFDNIATASSVTPPLTTMKQDTVKAGELLVSNLLKMIEGEEVESVQMQAELVIRESCGD
ncbi:MAG: DNA-binding LacI/PurR family transcriptional regulator [Alteromonadaceae bacterium]|jgi:DNA-binding LacI/PurR family transcriptional regulator